MASSHAKHYIYLKIYLYNLKKPEKHPWKSVTFKVTLLHWCVCRFLNRTNGANHLPIRAKRLIYFQINLGKRLAVTVKRALFVESLC